MAVPENPKVGGCYIWVISFLLFVFTAAGAVFLVLYITQPESSSASWYPIIGVTLVFLPWFFWVFTILYRIVSRVFGFRMMCFGRTTSHVNDVNVVVHPRSSAGGGGGGGRVNGGDSPRNLASSGTVVDGILLNGNRNEASRQMGSPRHVHFGGIVILGEDDNGGNGEGNPRSLSRSSSSSSSSSSSRHSNESELPLRLMMAS